MAHPDGPSSHAIEAQLHLEDGQSYTGYSFGAPVSSAGEVVFCTGMVGYPEALTDPSYYGQILVCTFPLIGNYGVPSDEDDAHIREFFESNRIQVKGLIISDYSRQFSHWQAMQSLAAWLRKYNIPGLMGVDTRAITKRLRIKGAMLGKVEFPGQPIDFYDPNSKRLVEAVSITEPETYGTGDRKVIVLDCGCKESIAGNIAARGVTVKRVPWNWDLQNEEFDGLLISSGPGDPKICNEAIHQIRHALKRDKPVMGICLGHQMLALAVGAETYKLKFGHRSQNQPVMDEETKHCYVTSQNHGFAVDASTLPPDWKAWFTNLNDGTNEGIKHVSKPFMSVQFHPEANPGPVDTKYLFDDFIRMVNA